MSYVLWGIESFRRDGLSFLKKLCPLQFAEAGVRALGIYWAHVSLDQSFDLSVIVFLVGEMGIIFSFMRIKLF